MFKNLMFFCYTLIIFFISGCGLETYQSGDLPTQKRLDMIQKGQPKERVTRILGTPLYDSKNIVPQYKNHFIIYGRVTKESRAFLPPEETERQIYVIFFDDTDTVTEIRRLTKKDGVSVPYDETQTPTGGQELSALEQIAKNFGRYDAGGRDATAR